jgi:hypothetical protein
VREIRLSASPMRDWIPECSRRSTSGYFLIAAFAAEIRDSFFVRFNFQRP